MQKRACSGKPFLVSFPPETGWLSAYVFFHTIPQYGCNKPFLSSNMRTTIAMYRQLGQYLAYMHTTYTAFMNSSKPLSDPSVDSHFRPVVYLGIGVCNMILCMMPGELTT